jgi:hypothetical protein
MKREDSEVSAMIATARDLIKLQNLNSSEKLLGRIIVRTVMSLAQPEMLSEEELNDLRDLAEKVDLSEDDIIRMVASIMAERLVQKIKEIGGDDYFVTLVNS